MHYASPPPASANSRAPPLSTTPGHSASRGRAELLSPLTVTTPFVSHVVPPSPQPHTLHPSSRVVASTLSTAHRTGSRLPPTQRRSHRLQPIPTASSSEFNSHVLEGRAAPQILMIQTINVPQCLRGSTSSPKSPRRVNTSNSSKPALPHMGSRSHRTSVAPSKSTSLSHPPLCLTTKNNPSKPSPQPPRTATVPATAIQPTAVAPPVATTSEVAAPLLLHSDEQEVAYSQQHELSGMFSKMLADIATEQPADERVQSWMLHWFETLQGSRGKPTSPVITGPTPISLHSISSKKGVGHDPLNSSSTPPRSATHQCASPNRKKTPLTSVDVTRATTAAAATHKTSSSAASSTLSNTSTTGMVPLEAFTLPATMYDEEELLFRRMTRHLNHLGDSSSCSSRTTLILDLSPPEAAAITVPSPSSSAVITRPFNEPSNVNGSVHAAVGRYACATPSDHTRLSRTDNTIHVNSSAGGTGKRTHSDNVTGDYPPSSGQTALHSPPAIGRPTPEKMTHVH